MPPDPSRPGRLTNVELRLTEQYVSVLDFVSRCAQAVEEGNWYYLLDKSRQLQDAAERLQGIASEAYQATQAGKRPRAEAVGAAVAWFGRHYRAARLLHPLEQVRKGGER
jgi:hypothetical protein